MTKGLMRVYLHNAEHIKQEGIFVSNEISPLSKILMHRPDQGIEKVTPVRAVELLYEDIVFLPKMQKEHDLFTEAISWFIGTDNVLEVEKLLADVLQKQAVKEQLLTAVACHESINEKALAHLNELSPPQLANALITGIGNKESQFLNPLPNLIFTRDIGVVMNDHILIAKAAKNARLRESLLCHFIFKYHPEFNSASLIDFLGENLDCKNEYSIEGGDVMMFAENHLLIGHSERTNIQSIEKLKEQLFSKGVVEMISVVEMPKERSCMHLDTIFTRISKEICIGFESLVSTRNKMVVQHYMREKDSPVLFTSLKEMLNAVYGNITIVPCGKGQSPYDEREQWTDGCNLFSIKEGVAFTYERNAITNESLRDYGFNIVAIEDLLQDFKEDNIRPENVTQTIITLPSSELSRARGGTHCLTMPLLRI
ncbi:MAG: arginine deiminase family protein [Cytophagaceae bacterium]